MDLLVYPNVYLSLINIIIIYLYLWTLRYTKRVGLHSRAFLMLMFHLILFFLLSALFPYSFVFTRLSKRLFLILFRYFLITYLYLWTFKILEKGWIAVARSWCYFFFLILLFLLLDLLSYSFASFPLSKSYYFSCISYPFWIFLKIIISPYLWTLT